MRGKVTVTEKVKKGAIEKEAVVEQSLDASGGDGDGRGDGRTGEKGIDKGKGKEEEA